MARAVKILSIFLLALFAMPCTASSAPEEKVLVYQRESLYYTIRVMDTAEGIRYLVCDNQVQSSMLKADRGYMVEKYNRVMLSTLALSDDFERIAVVGLGGGRLAGYLSKRYPDLKVDVIELDPEVARAAREFFGFTPSDKMSVITGDARVFLRKTEMTYDFILLDAFYGDTIPFHLTTREFFSTVKDRLNPGGIVVGHYWAPGMNEYFNAQLRTYLDAFSEVYMIDTGEKSIILVGKTAKGAFDMKKAFSRAREITAVRRFNFNMADLLRSGLVNVTGKVVDAPVLTDDYAPVNILNKRPLR